LGYYIELILAPQSIQLCIGGLKPIRLLQSEISTLTQEYMRPEESMKKVQQQAEKLVPMTSGYQNLYISAGGDVIEFWLSVRPSNGQRHKPQSDQIRPGYYPG